MEHNMDNFDSAFFKEFVQWCIDHGIEWVGDDANTIVRGPDGWSVVIPKGMSMADCYPRLATFLSLYDEGFAPHADVPITERQLREFNSRQNLFRRLWRQVMRFTLSRQEFWMN